MTLIAQTPEPPYYAVIFTSHLASNPQNTDHSYETTAQRMLELAVEQDGFIGVESAREQVGITVSYWRDLESIKKWKQNAEHQQAQKLGRNQWYSDFNVRIARVEREYGTLI